MKQTMVLLLAYSLRAGDVSTLSWMTGCWVAEQGPVTIEEQWNRPVDGQMMGVSRTIRASKVVFSEFMRIDTEKGEIFYLPRIGTTAPAVRFKLTTQSDTEVVFENPAHPFPQRILYRKTEPGLFARIDGKQNGKDRAEDFPMKLVPCR
ncbi:MAG TPA: DUF6265 family protein [Candidatus Acidoferrales bacterium]|nr:DUF6265 family protein [Candidatus Acidoferrales bacterium]